MCLWFWVGGKPSAVAVNRLLSALTLLGGFLVCLCWNCVSECQHTNCQGTVTEPVCDLFSLPSCIPSLTCTISPCLMEPGFEYWFQISIPILLSVAISLSSSSLSTLPGPLSILGGAVEGRDSPLAPDPTLNPGGGGRLKDPHSTGGLVLSEPPQSPLRGPPSRSQQTMHLFFR